MTKPVVNILWTGGWDSTYRVLCLSRMDVVLQPHYILYKNRYSHNKELEAMKTISEIITNDPLTKCEFKPLIVMDREDIEKDEEITKSFYSVKEKIMIGQQYEYIARYVKNIDNMEIGVEQGGFLCEESMNKVGKMDKIKDKYGLEYWALDNKKSPKDLVNVFGKLRFPIFELTKKDMEKLAIEKGFIDTMQKTWFCHFPHKGKPCGSCFPCMFTIEDGFPNRFSKEALKRYDFEKKHNKQAWYKIYKRVRRKLFKY